MTAKMLLFTVFCCVSGGPYGLEGLVGASGSGMALLLVLVIPLLWAIPDALVTAELSSAMPVEGGYYQWVKRAMGPFAAFLNGWWTWLYGMIDASLYPIYFAASLGAVVQLASGSDLLGQNPLLKWAVGFSVIVLFTWINVRGARLVGQLSVALAGLIIVPFILMGLAALFRWQQAPGAVVSEFTLPGQSITASLAGGLSIAMWNYLGWDSLSTIAGEVEEPQRAYPMALLWGVPLVTAVYVIALVAGRPFLPNSADWVDGAWPAIAHAVGGPWLFWIISLGAGLSSMALFTATFLGASRLPFVMAEDGFMPPILVRTHPRFGTPHISILFCAGVYAILGALFTWRELVAINVVLYATALVMEAASLVIFRVRDPGMPRPFRIPGGLGVAVAFGLVPLAMIVALIGVSIWEGGWQQVLPTAVCLASGPLAWTGIQAFRRLRPANPPTLAP